MNGSPEMQEDWLANPKCLLTSLDVLVLESIITVFGSTYPALESTDSALKFGSTNSVITRALLAKVAVDVAVDVAAKVAVDGAVEVAVDVAAFSSAILLQLITE